MRVPRRHSGSRGGLSAVLYDSTETHVCVKCGRSHDPQNRARLIRPMADMEPNLIAVAWPCFYGDYRVNVATERALFRDIRAAKGLHR